MSHDIYNWPKRLEYVLSEIKKDKAMTGNNKKMLLDFNNNCTAEGLSLARKKPGN
jgi:hypothetical protein